MMVMRRMKARQVVMIVMWWTRTVAEKREWERYKEVMEVEESRSLKAVRDVAVKRYEMSHDTVSGRVHYGVLAKDAEAFGFYGERVSREEAVPGARHAGLMRSIAEARVLFAHCLSATRELARAMPFTLEAASESAAAMEVIAGQLMEAASSLTPGWENAGQIRAKLDAASAELEAAKAVLEAVEKRRGREIEELRQLAMLKNATLIERFELAMNLTAFRESEKRRGFLKKDSLERVSVVELETLRKTTALSRLDDEFKVQQSKEQLRLETAVSTAVEAEKRKAAMERANEDVSLRRVAARGDETRQKVLGAIKAIAVEIKDAADTVRSRPDRLGNFVKMVISILAGFFFLRESATLTRRLLEQYLLRPALLREFSKSSQFFDDDDDVILPTETANTVNSLAKSLRGAKKRSAPLRHCLLYGPPGTGKTMVARRLAQMSGLDWAVMSGGDVGPLGPQATTELHKLLKWAERSSRGLVLFVDEAEAALADRSKSLSEAAVSALNAFLTHTSAPSYKVMLVLATNRPADLDAAVLDRIDDVVCLPLPDPDARLRLLKLYLFKAFDNPSSSSQQQQQESSLFPLRTLFFFFFWFLKSTPKPRLAPDFPLDSLLADLVPATAGFSGREIAKLLSAVQAAVFSQHAFRTGLSNWPLLTVPIWHAALRAKRLHLGSRTGGTRPPSSSSSS